MVEHNENMKTNTEYLKIQGFIKECSIPRIGNSESLSLETAEYWTKMYFAVKDAVHRSTFSCEEIDNETKLHNSLLEIIQIISAYEMPTRIYTQCMFDSCTGGSIDKCLKHFRDVVRNGRNLHSSQDLESIDKTINRITLVNKDGNEPTAFRNAFEWYVDYIRYNFACVRLGLHFSNEHPRFTQNGIDWRLNILECYLFEEWEKYGCFTDFDEVLVVRRIIYRVIRYHYCLVDSVLRQQAAKIINNKF